MDTPGTPSSESMENAASHIPVFAPRSWDANSSSSEPPEPASREDFDRLEKEVSSRSYDIAMQSIHETTMRDFIRAISNCQWYAVEAWLADDVEFVQVPLRLGGICHGAKEVVAHFTEMQDSGPVYFLVDYMIVDQGYITSIVEMRQDIPDENLCTEQIIAWIISLDDDNKIIRMEHRDIGAKKYRPLNPPSRWSGGYYSEFRS
ncbi:hypothetical protein CGLO_09814 [Colletotrichum gloeosporioides Cg-14]|uniref:SnoaL-like domain-containing protein n=1 Tax=Colletotrichum gloeosporioides (strain Cg-14) TaxID=1237896 RepID=T0KF11_COLGC|nr:hypothetical protein CGLO_09814 [Colletotrichum gloeosporioides Cg-14]